jgi:hypothetical protein
MDMSVAEILHQIDALPQGERTVLLQRLFESRPHPEELVAELSASELAELREKLAKRPSLGAELGQIIDRMQAGNSVDLNVAVALHHQLEKLGL